MKKISFITALIIGLLLFNPIATYAASNVFIDSKRAEDGIVRIQFTGITKKTKVMVEKDSTKYYYDLKTEEDFFPLQLGQGSYTVSVLENIQGTAYKVVAEKSFRAAIAEENSVYLQSTQPILWNEDMEAIKLAKSIAADEKDNAKVVQAIYEYIVNNVSYDYDKMDKLKSDYTPDIDSILSEGKGICYDYSVLFGAMLRSRGIPTKLVKGYRSGLEQYHAWNEVYLDGSWKTIDTTYNACILKTGTSIQMFQDSSQYQKLKEY